jgi:nucleotide-binding universal stress UspA family protein
MNRILVPLNARSDYQNILKYAESVAQRSGAELTILYNGGPYAAQDQGVTYHHQQPVAPFVEGIRKTKVRQQIKEICQRLFEGKVAFQVKVGNSYGTGAIEREANQNEYDLLLMGTHPQPGLKGLWQGALASRVIGAVKTPVFVVPNRNRFNEIQHITYAVDLSDYDPTIIQQVKAIASLFDAKLTIAHVNAEHRGEDQKQQYLSSLEKTISDTLDYPKIYYRFFDHADPLAGLKKLVNLNESNIVAMTNRKKASNRPFSFDRSLTRKMARELKVPILAFRKHR